MFDFGEIPGNELLVRVGVSYASVNGAWANIESDLPEFDFDRVQRLAEESWNRELSRILVEKGSPQDTVTFYTALYHALLHPNVWNDANGEYAKMDHSGIGKWKDGKRYSLFSLWDTFRNLHSLLTLLWPEQQRDMIRSMLGIYREGGFLPQWELAGSETRWMVGDPAVPVIVDSYRKGIRDFDAELALEAMLKSADEQGDEWKTFRYNLKGYLEQGWVSPHPRVHDSKGPTSLTLEYVYADWCISVFAKELGREEIARRFANRAKYYKNVWDPKTGYFRMKDNKGRFVEPFEPRKTWGEGHGGYVEGHADNYLFYVPHDIKGLAEIMGGDKAFVNRLDKLFATGGFDETNEPDIAYPYLYSYFPEYAHKASEKINQYVWSKFKTGPQGIPGNDDCGTLSTYFLFSAMGFYPDCPGRTDYALANPLFGKISIFLDGKDSKPFVILRKGEKDDYSLKPVRLNGEKFDQWRLPHASIVAGGELLFEKANP